MSTNCKNRRILTNSPIGNKRNGKRKSVSTTRTTTSKTSRKGSGRCARICRKGDIRSRERSSRTVRAYSEETQANLEELTLSRAYHVSHLMKMGWTFTKEDGWNHSVHLGPFTESEAWRIQEKSEGRITRCHCDHVWSMHDGSGGDCLVGGCGCSKFKSVKE